MQKKSRFLAFSLIGVLILATVLYMPQLAAAEMTPYEIVATYAAPLPDHLTVRLQYTTYFIPTASVLITAGGANIRSMPDPSASIVGKAVHFEKVPVRALVRGSYVANYLTDLWYEVEKIVGDQTIHGYILATLGEVRIFQFEEMLAAAQALKAEVDGQTTAYISNYKNWNGLAPLHQGLAIDPYGVKRSQSAPAYLSASTTADFRYIADGTLVTILEQIDSFYKIRTLNFPGDYYVPKRYVSLQNSIDQLMKVIVIDRKNQNEGVFEYSGGHWFLVSYSFATTGELAKYKEPTDLGYYMAINKVDKFLYLDDVTREIAGYAPYGIRFGGGAYIHGVPVNLRRTVPVGQRVTYFPPMIEYSSTIGTIPRSHKCVRNYTSHAKYLWDWSEIGKTAVIVIE